MTTITQQSDKVETLKEEAKELTQLMRFHQEELAARGTERRKLFKELFLAGVTQGNIAKICGVSRQTVVMEIKRFNDQD